MEKSMNMNNDAPGYPHTAPPSYDNLPPQNVTIIYPNAQPAPPIYVQPRPPVFIQHPQTVVIAPNVGPNPTLITCPSCRNNIVTRLDYETSPTTHLCALALCLIGFWPCVLIPYCTTTCRNANHYCPSCGAYVGTFTK